MTAPQALNTRRIHASWDVDPEDLPGLLACLDDQAVPLQFELTSGDNRVEFHSPGFCFKQHGRLLELRGESSVLQFELNDWLQARVIGSMEHSIHRLELALALPNSSWTTLKITGPAPGSGHGALIWRVMLEAMTPLDPDRKADDVQVNALRSA